MIWQIVANTENGRPPFSITYDIFGETTRRYEPWGDDIIGMVPAMIYDYYMWSGDKDIVLELWNAVVKIVENAVENIRDGIYYGFPEGGNKDDTKKDGVFAVLDVNAHIMNGFYSASKLAEIVGDDEKTKRYSKIYRNMVRAINKEFWSDEMNYLAYFIGVKKEGFLLE